MPEGFVQLPATRLYYLSIGSGDPLVFLHGGPAASHDYFIPSTTPLSKSFRLIFFDQRGSGKSSKAKDGQYDIRVMAEDLERLRKDLQLGKINVLGHSYGGMLAQEYALNYPDSIHRLMLVSTFASTQGINERLRVMKESASPEIRTIIDRYEAEGLFKNRKKYPIEYNSASLEAYKPFFFRFLQKLPPEVEASLGKLAYDVYRIIWGEEGEFKVTGNLRAWNVLDQLYRISVPTLIVVGRYDMPSVEMAEEIHRRIPNSHLRVFEKSSHLPFIEEREKFIQVVRNFLEQ